MYKRLRLLLSAGVMYSGSVQAQAMDNTVSFRNIPGNAYFRINYENDFFAAFDREYTQGILVEKVNPRIGHLPWMKVLWHPENSDIKYGLAIEHNAYTPDKIDQFKIQYGDRPFAGVLLLKSFIIADNFEKRVRISQQFSVGIMGPGAGGEQIQRTIHHWIKYLQPEGWHNQIHNDLAINFQMNAEKEIYRYGNHFLVSAYGSARIGTLSDKLSAGFTASLGNFSAAFSHRVVSQHSLQWYLYFHLTGNAIAYDATLQGGTFNHSSPYTIPADDIRRFTLQEKFGLVLIFRSLYLEYYRTGSTEEYLGGIYHRTGGLQIGFGF